ncbi:GNAT family N-acetyltransferase [Nonomuraea sp. NPDC000554]|uniref:GNAT family N-acetyltransferase n=1 Tax=Nonomuraea sp. NPDC000554 TaxID=3154259 RepID=UPI00333073D4
MTDQPVAHRLAAGAPDSDRHGPLGRAVAFQRAFARRKAGAVVEVPGGFAVLNERYPGSHDDNKLIVWTGDDPATVIAAADETLAARRHRLVQVDDDDLGRAFAPAFVAAGYDHETNLFMAFQGELPRNPPPAQHLDLETIVPVLREEWRESLPSASDEVVEQLATRVEARLRGADQVGFRGVRAADGELASRADLYLQGGVAQIETVHTSSRHRGQGHARALMTALLAEAGAAGSELIFLVADDADWPKEFYARLGFEPIGRTHAFLRA